MDKLDLNFLNQIFNTLGFSEAKTEKAIKDLTELHAMQTTDLLIAGLDEKLYKELEMLTENKTGADRTKIIGEFLKKYYPQNVFAEKEKNAAEIVMGNFAKFAMDNATAEQKIKIARLVA
ncbi:MAG: hypothetical protein Q8Q46_00045 [Candidatus Giovannonibacteria bacterium]|nr:hypothetical protein [Candidatus Giovannonibacteria bacterium]